MWLLAFLGFTAGLVAFWTVPPLVWGTLLHDASAGDVLRHVAYAQEGTTSASGVLTPFDSGAFWALVVFDVAFWLVVLAALAVPVLLVVWLLDRRDLRAVQADLKRKGIRSG